MRQILFLLVVAPSVLFAQGSQSGSSTLSGRWMVSADFYGTPINFPLELEQQGDKITGNFGGDKLEGSVHGNSIKFLAKDEQGGTEDCAATVHGSTMSGSIIFTDSDDPAHPNTHQFHGATGSSAPRGTATTA